MGCLLPAPENCQCGCGRYRLGEKFVFLTSPPCSPSPSSPSPSPSPGTLMCSSLPFSLSLSLSPPVSVSGMSDVSLTLLLTYVALREKVSKLQTHYHLQHNLALSFPSTVMCYVLIHSGSRTLLPPPPPPGAAVRWRTGDSTLRPCRSWAGCVDRWPREPSCSRMTPRPCPG